MPLATALTPPLLVSPPMAIAPLAEALVLWPIAVELPPEALAPRPQAVSVAAVAVPTEQTAAKDGLAQAATAMAAAEAALRSDILIMVGTPFGCK